MCVFRLTFIPDDLIYESRCDSSWIANFDVRENVSMKYATAKKPAKKAPAKKKAAAKKKK
jgi:hypothetical protein